MSPAETYEFKTEARQVLELMVHSVYSNKDIFLRELISNSSDALDKRRYESVRNPDCASASEPAIRIKADSANRILSISDNGIGMDRDEVHRFIGTIAKSGAQEFLQALKKKKESADLPELIGQFGVGFYASFMVSNRVEILTRRAGTNTATHWESKGDGEYTISDAERDEAGTTVILHLKPADSEDGLNDFCDSYEIRRIVKKYSDYVAYPIFLETSSSPSSITDDAQDCTASVNSEQLNSMKAIWLREKEEVTDEEYNEFYKHLSHDWKDPLLRIQAKIEGTLEYRILLYIPENAPYDMMLPSHAAKHGLHLYIKRVFIMDDCHELLPDYFRFVRGLVDSEDLPLNISRELLQENRQVQRMSKGIVAKLLSALKTLHENEKEKYQVFWKQFGRVLKEGLATDSDNRQTLLDMCLFHTTQAGDVPISLDTYVARMKPGQSHIYYLSGESRLTLETSPHLEAFRSRDIEVLLLSDPVDEFWTHHMDKYKDHEFKSIGRGTIDFNDCTTDTAETVHDGDVDDEKYKPLFDALKTALLDQVKEVRLSSRLTDSPACLVVDESDITPQLEKMMKLMGQDLPKTKRILEINPAHELIEKLRGLCETGASSETMQPYAQLLHGAAILSEGGQIEDPAALSKNIAAIMGEALGH